MSHNVTQDNVWPVLDGLHLFSGQHRLKASFSNNGTSPCQQKLCQPQRQLGSATVLAVDDSRALKHSVCVCVGGGSSVLVAVPGFPPQFALKQPVIHCFPLLPLLSCCWPELGALPIHLLKICFACTEAPVML